MDYRLTLVGYKEFGRHTNWFPWNRFHQVFTHLGYDCDWWPDLTQFTSKEPKRIFICWNRPLDVARQLVNHPCWTPDHILLQKLHYGEQYPWTDTPEEFFRNWHWPYYELVCELAQTHRVFGFGCKTAVDQFPRKKLWCDKLDGRIFWIPWGSSVYSYEELMRAAPVMAGFTHDVGFVGSRWGQPHRGNAADLAQFLEPLTNNGYRSLVRGPGFCGPVSDAEHAGILKTSRLCPIVHAVNWRIERGVQDRFWTVFSSGRFGVVDNEGVYEFFDHADVVCTTDPGEYLELSRYYLAHVEAQRPYIEKVLGRIQREYNYYVTWKRILEAVVRE